MSKVPEKYRQQANAIVEVSTMKIVASFDAAVVPNEVIEATVISMNCVAEDEEA